MRRRGPRGCRAVRARLAGSRGSPVSPRTLGLTALALAAFAANSLLCRLALGAGSIDAASFAAVRLVAGALVLVLVLALRGERAGGSWSSALALAAYAVAFSAAYVTLGAATGTLILFAAVQLTMVGAGIRAGEHLRGAEPWGHLAALAGLAVLVAPGVRAPAPAGAVLMGLAGFAWGLYSLAGRSSKRPTADTAGNFLRAAPLGLAAAILPVVVSRAHVDARGVVLAALSGGVTSGLGYVAWYAAVPGLGAQRAAVAQLAVPWLAAVGAVVLLDEPATLRLAVAASLIVGGVALALRERRRA